MLEDNGEKYIAFHHTNTDSDCNLRAYIPALTASLQCSMDVQSSDGKGMLLKYVTSYVSKCHDIVKSQQPYSRDLGAYQAATFFLKHMHPLEPEMVLQLTSVKIAWSNSRTKAVTAPTPDQPSSKAYLKYLSRSPDDESLSFLEWLHLYDHEKSPPKQYETGNTLVAVKHFCTFNPLYFHQLLVMNLPHRSADDLMDPCQDCLPEPIRYFVPARDKLPHILGSSDAIRSFLASESHKRSYVETLLYDIKSLEDIYTIWQVDIIDTTFASSARSQFELRYPLSPQQLAIYSRFYLLVQQQQRQIYGSWSTSRTSIEDQWPSADQ